MSTRCPELVRISTVIDRYIEGVRNDNIEALQQAFHPQASMFGWKGNDVYITPIQGLYEYVASTPVPATTGDLPTVIITSMQVTGNAATVGLVMDGYHAHDFMDYFHLLKIDDRWWIVSKLFQADPRR